MLLPPSVLLILYGVLGGASIGALFIAGIVPGLLLAMIMAAYIIGLAVLRPAAVGGDARSRRHGRKARHSHDVAAADVGNLPTMLTAPRTDAPAKHQTGRLAHVPTGRLFASVSPVILLVVLVLGGIWGGFMTPTEAAAVGAFGALIMSLFFGLRWKQLVEALISTALTTGSILLLLLGAQLLSRSLARSGLISFVGDALTQPGMTVVVFVVVAVLVLLLLGTVLDSASILTITVPFFVLPVEALGIDPIWFGIVAIIAIEVGLLTPPFGMLPFVISSVLGDKVPVEDVFIGSIPFVLCMLLLIGILALFPVLVTWLPGLLI